MVLKSKNNPFSIFKSLYGKHVEYCKQNNILNHDCVYLATCSLNGLPSLRTVLIKQFNENGFIFYTNTKSQKGIQLLENPNAAMLFHWNYKGMQIRIEGSVTLVEDEVSDSYFATRPRMSKIGAHASKQSEVMKTPFNLMQRLSYYVLKFKLKKDEEIPRPLHWKGFILKPVRFEFWKEGAFRIHKRHAYTLKNNGKWVKESLFP